MKIGAIEAGGTKFVCAVSDEQLTIVAREQIPTTTPAETMGAVISFFQKNPVDAMGIGSFGPIDVAVNSATYGYITATPKVGWRDYDFLGTMKKAFDIPYVWTTDVNVAAYGELKLGAGQGLKSCVYLTVGTGIGGGAVINGQLLHGFGHPEMGHMLIRHDPADTYQGHCPFHADCLEGLAAGPALEQRYQRKAQTLAGDDPAWTLEANYLAQACVDLTVTLSPEMIIFGGGVMKQQQLFPLIRQQFAQQLAGYVPTPAIDDYIVPVQLGDNAGITGCLLLAQEQLR